MGTGAAPPDPGVGVLPGAGVSAGWDSSWSFASTYRKERSFIAQVVRRLGVPPSDVEDVVQEVFVVLHSHLPALEQGTPLRLWLRAVAIRVSSNHRRRLTRRRRWPGRDGDAIDPDTLVDARQCPPDECLAQSEVRLLLARAVRRLDKKKREVFLLSEVEERTALEIAGLIRVSPNTVSSRLRAARRHLAQSLRGGTRELC